MGCNLSLDTIEDDGRHLEGEKHPIQFTVTAELIKAAEALINSQKAQYREPKTTAMSLDGEPVPEAVWNVGKKQG